VLINVVIHFGFLQESFHPFRTSSKQQWYCCALVWKSLSY